MDRNWIIDSISDSIIAVDKNFAIVYVNSAALTFIKKPLSKLIGENLWTIYRAYETEPVAFQIKQSMASGVPIRYEHYSTSNKKWIRTHTYPSDKGLAIYFSDITSYKNVEQRLKEQARMIELMSDAVLVVDTTCRILFWNSGAEKLYGWTARETMGQKSYELLKTVYPQSRRKLLAALKTNSSVNIELEEATQDGTQLTVNSSWEKYTYYGVPAYLVINRDITEQRHMDDKKDEFLSIAAHELKTPLTSVKAYSQLIERLAAKGSVERIVSVQQKQLHNINKLNRLISDLLDVTKIKAGKLELKQEKGYLETVVTDAIESVQSMTVTHKIARDGSGDVWFEGDVERIEQVIVNLLTNAVKYSPQADTVKVTLTHDGKLATVGVIDYGVGIPKKEQGKLFDRYYRIRNSTNAPGLGLGLYLANEIVTRLGGKMWVESVLEKGSAFYFTLPISKAA